MRSHSRLSPAPWKRRLAILIALASLGACSSGGREGTLAATTALPSVTCSAGFGGVTTVSGITSAIGGINLTYGFSPTYLPSQGIGLRDPFNPSAVPPTSIQVLSPPYSSTTSVQTMSVTASFVFSDASISARTFNCTKTGTDSPTPSISCSSVGINPFDSGSYAEVRVRQTELQPLASEGYSLNASWWWDYLPLWLAVLQPWSLAGFPDTATDVAFAESTSHTILPDTKLTTEKYQQTFKSSVGLGKPGDAAAAVYGHVRVEVTYRGQPVSFRSEADCTYAG